MTEESSTRGNRKSRVGVAVSDAKDKTVVVRVERRTRHPLYGKVVRTYKKFHAHDESNQAHKGDSVRIVESRPVSKLKRWRLTAVISTAPGT
ncbi:MAG: 30S ribosomal protein S17 [Verrucomicrobia bacterium]|nr:30S ribosomal protein S17 [Verrucomicrobiota bacterium]MDA1085738.1 30S ribosomal protein S17 [Verrucomicrobiota bacterium]